MKRRQLDRTNGGDVVSMYRRYCRTIRIAALAFVFALPVATAHGAYVLSLPIATAHGPGSPSPSLAIGWGSLPAVQADGPVSVEDLGRGVIAALRQESFDALVPHLLTAEDLGEVIAKMVEDGEMTDEQAQQNASRIPAIVEAGHASLRDDYEQVQAMAGYEEVSWDRAEITGYHIVLRDPATMESQAVDTATLAAWRLGKCSAPRSMCASPPTAASTSSASATVSAPAGAGSSWSDSAGLRRCAETLSGAEVAQESARSHADSNPARRGTMHRSRCPFAAVATLAITLLTLAQVPPAAAVQAEAGWIDVLSVRIGANGLIVIVCRDVGDVHLADGNYRGRGAGVVFKDGTIVSVTGRESYGVEEVTIGDEGEIILLSTSTATGRAGTDTLLDGEYRSSGGPGTDRTRTTFATGFRIRDGAIVSALVGRS